MDWVWFSAILLIAMFIPRYDFLALYKDWLSARKREQVEDALKHLLEREQSGRHASPESLAGTLDLEPAPVFLTCSSTATADDAHRNQLDIIRAAA